MPSPWPLFVDVTPAVLALDGGKQCGPSAADFDRDGDLDLVSPADAASTGVRVLRNDGGMLQAWTDATPQELLVGYETRGLLPVDLTHDGYPDLVRVGLFQIDVFVNGGAPEGALSLGWTWAWPADTGLGFEGAGVADVTGDGWLDVLLTGATLANWVLINPADGSVALAPDDQADDGLPPAPINSDFSTVGDWDLDGDPDWVIREAGLGSPDAWLRTPTGWVADTLDLDASNDAKGAVALCDGAGGGALDLLWSAPVEPSLSVFRWTGSWSAVPQSLDPLPVRSLTCADLNADGLSDVVLSADDGDVVLAGPWVEVFALPSAGATVGTVAADFDGDGDLDLYLAQDGETNRLLENRLDDGRGVEVRLQRNVGTCEAPVLREDVGGSIRGTSPSTSRLELSGGYGRGQVAPPGLMLGVDRLGATIEVRFAGSVAPVVVAIPAGVASVAIVDDDPDGDSVIAEPPTDTDRDGLADGSDVDSDGDGLLDALEAGVGRCLAPVDTDGDSVPDLYDLDSDADGLADSDDPDPTHADDPPPVDSGEPPIDSGTPPGDDDDDDATPPPPGTPDDSDGDGVP
ncbi:MAG: VCBS repeat-containing protein, partial [Myxococcota bacterium]